METQIVTSEELEKIVNKWVLEGWTLEGVQFAMSEASRRPAMAFVFFIRGKAVKKSSKLKVES
ncbi:MAG: DUF4177 domain-containing protein [bacterium]